MRSFTLFIICLIAINPLYGQVEFEFGEQPRVFENQSEIPIPFGVGINAAQFQRMDVTGDGLEEWVIWDINSGRILVYQESENGFTHLPEASYFFPDDVNGFMILADFDANGKKDLFTSSPFGIKAYRNISPAGASFPTWEVAQNFLRLESGSNLQANNLDIPLIMDIDGDGDLDIVTFNFVVGDYLEFFRNTSMERKGVPDIDGFAFPESRWGSFEFCDCESFSFGITCTGMPIGRIEPEENLRILHAGGHSILYEDFNGDGIRDLLLGRDECSQLYYLPNTGTNSAPLFETFSTALPNFGELPVFPIFHTGRLINRGLLISSNSSDLAGIFKADHSRNVFLMKPGNAGIEPFLQNQLIDFGENTRPFFKGFKTSGEMILTANTLAEGRVVGMAYRFEADQEGWHLREKDYLGLSSLDLTDLQYIEYQTSSNKNLFWITGVDTVGQTLRRRIFFGGQPVFEEMQELNLPVSILRPLDQIELFKYQNQDFLLLAKQSGELQLYQLNLDSPASATLLIPNFLGFSDNPATRNLAVHVIDDTNPSLYAVDRRGILSFYPDFMNILNRQEVNIRLTEEISSPSRLGRNTWISSVRNAFTTDRDLILGNTAGGLEYLNVRSSEPGTDPEKLQVLVYPNPNRGNFSLLVSRDAEIRLINSLGQILLDGERVDGLRPLEIQWPHLASGLYILQVQTDSGEKVIKRIIIF